MIVTKALALVEGGDATDEYPNGTFEVVLSAPTLDRDSEIIDPKAFEPLPDHIPFDIDHGMSVVTTVGSGSPYYAEDGTLRVRGGYASTPLAQEVRSLVSEGHIRTTSVTFMAAKREKDAKGVPHVVQAELLNGTFTPVPSNRESVVLSSKSAEAVLKMGARNSKKDAEAIQAAHDAMAYLGATCGAKSVKHAAPEGLKAIVGSLEATRDRVADAVEDAYATDERWCWLHGVLPDTVVFDVYDTNDGTCESFSQSYTDDGSVVTLTGEPVRVDVMEVVTPDPDADREPDAALKSATAAAEAAAPGAAAEAAVVADSEELKALLSVTEHATRLLFG